MLLCFVLALRRMAGERITIHVNSIPALVSLILHLVLAVTSLVNGRHLAQVAFALLSALLALISLGAFLLLEALPAGLDDPWVRYLMFQVPLVFLASLYFVLALTGAARRPETRLLGISLRSYVVLVVLSIVAVPLLVHWTSLLLIQSNPSTGLGPRAAAGPLLPWLLPLLVYVLAGPLALITAALRRAKPGAHRTLIGWSAAGVVLIYIAAPSLAGVSLWLGLDGRPFVFIGYTLASGIFYIALARYQMARVLELNQDLEHRVEHRTRSLREAQAKLVHSEKMAALGRLAAGMSHDLNSPVGALVSMADTLQRQTTRLEQTVDESGPGGAALHRALGRLRGGHAMVGEAAQRVSKIFGRLRAFSRLDQAELQQADLHQCLEEALDLAMQGQEGRIKVELRLGALPRIRCNPGQINQALFHVLENALEAMGDSGTLVITTRVRDDHAVLSVGDTGRGISEEDRDRVFDPGFTTKNRGIGSGLGLAVTWQIMEAHGGRIRVERGTAPGAVVSLWFPLSESVETEQRNLEAL
jgi:signal transduction histidine kinase